jgi:hypothetical protein
MKSDVKSYLKVYPGAASEGAAYNLMLNLKVSSGVEYMSELHTMSSNIKPYLKISPRGVHLGFIQCNVKSYLNIFSRSCIHT